MKKKKSPDVLQRHFIRSRMKTHIEGEISTGINENAYICSLWERSDKAEVEKNLVAGWKLKFYVMVERKKIQLFFWQSWVCVCVRDMVWPRPVAEPAVCS